MGTSVKKIQIKNILINYSLIVFKKVVGRDILIKQNLLKMKRQCAT